MHRAPLVGIMVALVAAVPAASLWTMRSANRAALRELRVAEGRLAQNTASTLHGFLDSFDRDTRVLATVAAGTRNHPIDVRAQDDAILQAFQAFDPYFTTKKRGEGTGLGLAIVWRIVRAHRGEISLRSAVGVGTVAIVTWPVTSAVSSARAELRAKSA